MVPKLGCPNVPEHGQVTEIQLAVDFVFVDGQRHRIGETWQLGCGCVIHDALVDWDAEEDTDGMMWSALLDTETGDPVLVWSDGLSDHITAESENDYEDSEPEDHQIDL